MEKEKVIISGVTGFVGSNLKPYLKEYYEVMGLSRRSDFVDVFSYELFDFKNFKGAKAFVHLAGKAHDLKKTSSDREYFEVNTELTKVLFDKFLESDCETFVFLSSVKAVADKVDSVLEETSNPKPMTAYGSSKLEAERYILSKPLPSAKRVYILRPAMIHGPNNKGNLNLLYQLVRKRIPYPLGAFENKRSFVSVDNLCFVIKNFMEKKPSSGVYHIADTEVLSTTELVELIGEAAGKKALIWKLPKPVVQLIAKTGNILRFPLNTERLEKLTENYVVSNKKCLEALQLPLPLNARAGLYNTIKTFEEKN